MAKNYKLTEEIKEFIVEQKKANPKLSCRGLTSQIEEHFQVDLSKSLINNVIKENSLSSPVGRKRVKEAVISKEAVKTQITRLQAEFMEGGGFFFLKIADLKLGLTARIIDILSDYLPNLAIQDGQTILEALMYAPYFSDKKSLWLLIGNEVSQDKERLFSEQLTQVPSAELKGKITKLGISGNINEINELYQGILLRLNSYIVHYFPPEYQFFDFEAMLKRFYSLSARLERKDGLLVIQVFYPSGFVWINDVIWLEGYSAAINKINEAKVLTPQKEQIWFSPHLEPQRGNAFLTP